MISKYKIQLVIHFISSHGYSTFVGPRFQFRLQNIVSDVMEGYRKQPGILSIL